LIPKIVYNPSEIVNERPFWRIQFHFALQIHQAVPESRIIVLNPEIAEETRENDWKLHWGRNRARETGDCLEECGWPRRSRDIEILVSAGNCLFLKRSKSRILISCAYLAGSLDAWNSFLKTNGKIEDYICLRVEIGYSWTVMRSLGIGWLWALPG
jgi:hypothetical protein